MNYNAAAGGAWGRGRGRGRGQDARPANGNNNGAANGLVQATANLQISSPPAPSQGSDAGRGRGVGGGGDRGRGVRGGRGRGGSERGGARTRPSNVDVVVSRPFQNGKWFPKQVALGTLQPDSPFGKPVNLVGNYFKVTRKTDWCIFHYRVDFSPEEEDTRMKKSLIRTFQNILGGYIFDGESLYSSHRLNPDPMVLTAEHQRAAERKYQITIRMVNQLAPTDVMFIQVFNILLRQCFQALGMEEMGRNFFDPRGKIEIGQYHLELWPGFKTSMRQCEHDILLCVELTHKVLRTDSCLQMISELMRQHRNDKDRVKENIAGNVVLTPYNNKTYKVDDIAWDMSPQSTFEKGGKQVSFAQYYQEKYNMTIRDLKQPLLLSRPSKKDLHRGMTGNLLLIPELCRMTGLDDNMRSNFQLMKALATHLHTEPEQRVQKISQFVRNLTGNVNIQQNLESWGLGFENKMVEFKGREMKPERIIFDRRRDQQGRPMRSMLPDVSKGYDWGEAFRSNALLSTVDLDSWVIIVPMRDQNTVGKLVSSMQFVANPLRFSIRRPDVEPINAIRPNDYANAVDKIMNERQGRVQMVFAILPRQATDTYSAVKRRACIEHGVPSQCFLLKNALDDRRLKSICTKLVIQMNAKLGGEPWTVDFPLPKLMVVGFDVYHCAKRAGQSVAAMVATTNDTQTKYFSTASFHSNREEMGSRVGSDFAKCLVAYQRVNGFLPSRVIFYRDGVGDGQLGYVNETELKCIQVSMNEVYSRESLPLPKFSFIVVTKRINTRIFGLRSGTKVNPAPGTVVDDVITLPERYDFYLVSQNSKIGTVSPVSYNVLLDQQGLDAEKMQRLTYKLCHLYFNWSGTVAVPAPCQYAHKLAYLTGLSLKGPSHERLSNLLYFL